MGVVGTTSRAHNVARLASRADGVGAAGCGIINNDVRRAPRVHARSTGVVLIVANPRTA